MECSKHGWRNVLAFFSANVPYRDLKIICSTLLVGLSLAAYPTMLAAHSLPGTTLTLAADTNGIHITIAVPLDDLNLAIPDGAGIASNPAGRVLSSAQTDRMEDYFGAHLAILLKDGSAVAGKLLKAQIEIAHNDEVGSYDLVVIDWFAPITDGRKGSPGTLIYDAVMHEVRNHIAAVLLQTPDLRPVLAGYIRVDPDLGKVAPFVLPSPP